METSEQTQLTEAQPLCAVWAIDPEEKTSKPCPDCLVFLKRLTGGSYVNVHPAYVCNHDGGLLKGHRLLENYLESLHIGSLAELDLVYSPTNLRLDWAERIVRRAAFHNAKLIILASRGRSAVANFFMGSFAHELLNISHLPLLLLAPQTPASVNLEKVMFTTDFSEASKEAFKNFLELVKGKAKEVVLFYVVDYPVLTMSAAETAGLPVYIPDSVLQEQREWAEQELQHWSETASKSGIEVKFQPIVGESMTSVTEAIERTAQAENVSLIGMTSHAGPLTRLVFGSVSRAFITKRKFNLCVYGPGFHG